MCLYLFYIPMAPNRYSLVCCPSVLFGCISPKGRANQGCGIGKPFRWLLSETHLSRLARVWLKGWVHSAHGHIEPPLVGVTTGDFCSEAGQAWFLSEKHGSCIWSEWKESSIIHSFEREVDVRSQYWGRQSVTIVESKWAARKTIQWHGVTEHFSILTRKPNFSRNATTCANSFSSTLLCWQSNNILFM